MSWAQFLKLHWEVLAATDFFTVEVATWHGWVTYDVLVVMALAISYTTSGPVGAGRRHLTILIDGLRPTGRPLPAA